jgi:hypothetical protein
MAYNKASESLRVSAYFNNGDSFQYVVVPRNEGFLVSRTSASHGYANLPELSTPDKLTPVVKQIMKELVGTYDYRDEPRLSVEGTVRFAAEAEILGRINLGCDVARIKADVDALDKGKVSASPDL